MSTETLQPAFSHNNIPVVFSSDNNYAPYLGVTIKSLIENSSAQYNYDIVILTKNINERNQQLIKKWNKKNISIRFYDVSSIVKPYEKLFYIRDRFTLETYYRLFIDKIFSQYNKLLYLDVDTCVLNDISKLFKINLDGYFTAAARSCSSLYNTYKNVMWDGRKFRDYQMEVLKLKNPYDYFQAGIMLFNIEKMKKNNFFEAVISKIKEIQNPVLVDQDILNAICNANNYLLNLQWNLEWCIPLSKNAFVFEDFFLQYLEAYNNPKIIHYNGKDKVWNTPNKNLAHFWWKYAYQTPFYEEILYKNLKIA